MRHLPRRVGSTDKLLNRLPAHLQIAKGTSNNQRPLLHNGASGSGQLGLDYHSEFASVTDAALQGFMHSPPPGQRVDGDPYGDYGGAAHDHQYFAGAGPHSHGHHGGSGEPGVAVGGSPYGGSYGYHVQRYPVA